MSIDMRDMRHGLGCLRNYIDCVGRRGLTKQKSAHENLAGATDDEFIDIGFRRATRHMLDSSANSHSHLQVIQPELLRARNDEFTGALIAELTSDRVAYVYMKEVIAVANCLNRPATLPKDVKVIWKRSERVDHYVAHPGIS